ncbi:serine-rich adhesin for platelets-like [Mytilus californianus]|uniref:serine-rich adhesin for platelets-like n=1 Tax=Mytilus californianus TaxID=6549 RepID=UPI002245C558|nr:serine-rich adhesin for platelets-like [Mytilus californianus]
MFGRLMSKVFGYEKKPDESSSKDRRHSFEDTSPHKHFTRSKGKKRSSPEAKRRRSDEPPFDFSNVKTGEGASKGNNSVDSSPDSEKSAWINVEIKPPSANLQESSNSEKNPTVVETDKSDGYIKLTQSKTSGESASPECVVNPPSPDQPVLVDGPAMSASIWESVDTSTTKEHVYKDCVVIETTSERKDRLSKEFQSLPDNSEGKVQLSTDSFIRIEEASEGMTSLNDKNWNNMNASAFLDIDMPTESESRRLTTSFVHIDQNEVFGLRESKNNVHSEFKSVLGELENFETVDEQSKSSSDKNSNTKDVITFGANSSKQQSEHDSMSRTNRDNTEEKIQSSVVLKTESMIENVNYNVDADAKYVVPKMPVSKGQGGNKLSKKLEKLERWKDKRRKSKTPEKSVAKKDTKSKEDANVDITGKENSSGLQQESNVVSNEVEKKILATENSTDVKTDNTNKEEKEAETSSKRDEKREQSKAEQTDVNTSKPKQKYVIPSKRNKGSISPSERPRKEKDEICASTSETREGKKEEKYETEPKNFLEFVQRKTAKGIIVDAKKLMFELGFLKDMKQTDINEAVIEQYRMAADRKFDYWIKQARYNAELIFTQDWIEENLPSLEGKREKKSDWRKKKQEKRKGGYSEYDRPAGGMCRDVRLETDPSLQVVRENVGSKTSIEKVANVETGQVLPENMKQESDMKSDNKNADSSQRSLDSSRSSRMKYSDVRLETNPNLMVVRENAGSRSQDQKEKTDRSSKMKYSDVRLETNPNLTVVRENAGSRSKDQKEKTDKSAKMKYSDVRLETNPNLTVVRENAADKSRSSRLKYTDVRLETNPNLTIVRENVGGKTKMLVKESIKDIQTNEESQQIISTNITDAEVIAEHGKNQNNDAEVIAEHGKNQNNDADVMTEHGKNQNNDAEVIAEHGKNQNNDAEVMTEHGKNQNNDAEVIAEHGKNQNNDAEVIAEYGKNQNNNADVMPEHGKNQNNDAEVIAEHGKNQNNDAEVMPEHDQILNNSTDVRKDSSEVSKLEFESEKFPTEPENESATKEGDITQRRQDQMICDGNLRVSSKVGTLLNYSEAVKSAGKFKENKTEKDDIKPDESDIDVKNEVSGALTSLLALVETEITKKFDDNGNPITEKQDKTHSENETKLLDHQGEGHDREIKERERMTEAKQTDMKRETITIISEVDVQIEGERFVVKTKLHESEKSNTGIKTETSDTLDHNKESKVSKEPKGQENDKQKYTAALGLIQSEESNITAEGMENGEKDLKLFETKQNLQKLEDGASDQKLEETEKLTSVTTQSETFETSSTLTQSVITLVNDVSESEVQKQVEMLAKEVENEIPVEMPANGSEKIDEKDKTADEKESIEEKSLPLTLTDSIFSLVQETRGENTQEKLESLVKGMAKTIETDESSIVTCQDTLILQADYKMQSESIEPKSDKVADTKTKVAISKAADDTKAAVAEDTLTKDITQKSIGHTKSMLDNTNRTDENKDTSDVIKTIEGVRKTLMDITKTVEDDRITIEDITKKVTNETLKTKDDKTIETGNVKTVQHEHKTIADVIETMADVKNTLKDITKTVEDDTKTIADLTKTVQDDIEKGADTALIDNTKTEGAEAKPTTDSTSISTENIQSKVIQTDIKTIEKGLKDLITEMAAKEKICTDDKGVNSDYSNIPTNSDEIGEQVRRSPLGIIGSLSPTMVRSCEFLSKDGNLSEADSLENLSVKSDGGSRSNSKSQRKTVGSRIQQPKSYSRSYETPNKSSYKERNWHGTTTPGRYGNSRHDSCKQPVHGWYDHSYGSPRQYGQYHSYSESHDKSNRGRGSYGNTPRAPYRKQNYNTPDRFQQTNTSSYKSHSYKESHYVKEHNGKTTDKFTHERKQARGLESDKHGSNYKSSDMRKSEMGGGIEKKIDKEKDYITTGKPKIIDTKYKSSDSRQKIEKKEEHYSKLSDKVSGAKSVNHKETEGSTSKKETPLPKSEDIPSKALESSSDKRKCSSEQVMHTNTTGKPAEQKPDLSEDTSKKASDSTKEGSHHQAQGTSKGATNSQKQKQKRKRRSNAKYKW